MKYLKIAQVVLCIIFAILFVIGIVRIYGPDISFIPSIIVLTGLCVVVLVYAYVMAGFLLIMLGSFDVFEMYYIEPLKKVYEFIFRRNFWKS